jgi:hypothetical protein
MATIVSSLGAGPGDTWADDGFAVVPGAFGPAACAAMADIAGQGSVDHRHPAVTRLGVDLVGRLGGGRVRAAGGRIVVTMPGASGRGWGRQRAGTVALHLALRPATADAGCPWVVPGSHRATPAGAAGVLPPLDDAVAVPLDIGDLVLLDGGLVHRVSDNRSLAPAAALLVVFRRPGV